MNRCSIYQLWYNSNNWTYLKFMIFDFVETYQTVHLGLKTFIFEIIHIISDRTNHSGCIRCVMCVAMKTNTNNAVQFSTRLTLVVSHRAGVYYSASISIFRANSFNNPFIHSTANRNSPVMNTFPYAQIRSQYGTHVQDSTILNRQHKHR